MSRASRILLVSAVGSISLISGFGLYWLMGLGVIPECQFQFGTGERIAKRYIQDIGAKKWPPLLVPIGRQIALHQPDITNVSERPGTYYRCTLDSSFVISEIAGRQCVNIKMLELLDSLRVIRFRANGENSLGEHTVSVSKGPRWRVYEEVLSPHKPNEYFLHLEWFNKFYRLTNVRSPKSNGDKWAVDFEYISTGDLLSNTLFKATGMETRHEARLEGGCQTSEPRGLVVRNGIPSKNADGKAKGVPLELAVNENEPVTSE